jgi:hypothetical protein
MDAMSKMIYLFRSAGLILFFGLCIILLSGNVKASAGENDVKLNVSDVSITKDGSYRLKVYNLSPEQSVIYRSGNSGIAMVSRTGKVIGLAYGETVISATVIEDGAAVATLQCNVTIGPAAVSVKLTKSNLVLQEGRQKLLTTVLLPLNTVESPVFFSTDSEIAKVSSAGRVRAVTAGSTQVYAFLENGQYAVCNVTVLNEEDYLKYREGISVEDILSENGENSDNNSENNDEETDPGEGNTEDNSSTGDLVPSESDNTDAKTVSDAISDDIALNE